MKIKATLTWETEVDTTDRAYATGVAQERFREVLNGGLREVNTDGGPLLRFEVVEVDGPTTAELDQAVAASPPNLADPPGYGRLLKDGRRVGLISLIKTVRENRKIDLVSAKRLVDAWRDKGLV